MSGSNCTHDCPGTRRLLTWWLGVKPTASGKGLAWSETHYSCFPISKNASLRALVKSESFVWQCSHSFYSLAWIQTHSVSAYVRHLVSMFGWAISGAWLCYWLCFTTAGVFFVCVFFKFMVPPMKAIQDVNAYKRVLDKTDVITWRLNLHYHFCACIKLHSVINKVSKTLTELLSTFYSAIQFWTAFTKILTVSRTTVTFLQYYCITYNIRIDLVDIILTE